MSCGSPEVSWRTICRLHRSVDRGSQASDQEQRLNLRYTRCVVAVSLTFLACWVPYLIYMHVCVAVLLSDTKWNSTAHIVLSCTGIGSMAVVPLVLGLANKQYTEPAYKLLQKLRDRWRKTQASEEVAVWEKLTILNIYEDKSARNDSELHAHNRPNGKYLFTKLKHIVFVVVTLLKLQHLHSAPLK